jgi:Glucosidase II beta subunit-like protein
MLVVIGTALLLVQFIARAEEVLCRRCGTTISRLSNVLNPAETPPASSKAEKVRLVDNIEGLESLTRLSNRVGQTFDMALFRTAQVKTVPSTRSIVDSFYPGYAWRVAECPVCGAFLGWSFDRPAECHDHTPDVIPEETHQKLSEGGNEKKSAPQEVLDRVFANHCLIKSLGYWNVEWCHKKQITQFHIPGPTLKRDPEYSLGSYPFAKEPEIKAEAGRRQIVQRFTGGQRCDETGVSRSTTVSLTCCAQSHQATGGPHQTAFIANFREPSVCSYEMTICVPELCSIAEFLPPSTMWDKQLMMQFVLRVSRQSQRPAGSTPLIGPR